MTQSAKVIFGAAGLVGLFAGSAYADDAPVWGTLSAAVTVASDYRFRGITQNDKQVTPEATLNWSGPGGFYAGTWDAKTNWVLPRPTGGTNNPSYEVDLYGGKHTDLDGTDLNIEAYYYSYPDYDAVLNGGHAASFYETIVQLAHTFGPVSLTATGAMSPQWAGGSGNGWYGEGTISYTVTDWLSLSGNVGHQWVHGAALAGSSDYTHYDIGGTATYQNWSLDARYVGTDLGKTQCGFWIGATNGCSGGFVATLTYNIASLIQ